MDVRNSPYSLRERLEWALYTVSMDITNSSCVFGDVPNSLTVSVDVPNSPYGLVDIPNSLRCPCGHP